MPDDRTVLDHLLEGRDALVVEVTRLSAAIEELDAVIGQIGGGRERLGNANGNGTSGAVSPPAEAAVTGLEPDPVEPVKPPVEVEPTPGRRAPSRARKVTPRKSAGRRSGGRSTEAPKSIRVHVLEMLAAEDREFGLAEIIDRVHGAGIQAHDDAVRSITIKLMKDGRVERVGRGQYRLAHRSSARESVTGEPFGDGDGADLDARESGTAPDDVDDDDAVNDAPDELTNDSETDAETPPSGPPIQSSGPFTPPLNLGQPWERS